LGVGVQVSGFRVQGSGFRVQGSGFRVQGSGFRFQGSGFRVDLGLRTRDDFAVDIHEDVRVPLEWEHRVRAQRQRCQHLRERERVREGGRERECVCERVRCASDASNWKGLAPRTPSMRSI